MFILTKGGLAAPWDARKKGLLRSVPQAWGSTIYKEPAPYGPWTGQLVEPGIIRTL
jgi:hypothetical protein